MVTEFDIERLTQKKFDKQAQFMHNNSPLKVKGIPHWYVIIRPGTFKDNYISDLETYFDEIDRYSNKLGSWDYPYVALPGSCRDTSTDWIESSYDYDYEVKGLRQHWRFHRSGQFVHIRSFLEEDESRCKKAKERTGHIEPEPPGYIGINSIIHTTTKIFEFAARLAQKFEEEDIAFVKIQMVGVKDFILYQEGDFSGGIQLYQIPTEPHLVPKMIDRTASTIELDELARVAANSLFKDFGKPNMPEWELKKIQLDLRSGKHT